jgi:hypothetical protein
MTDTEILEQMGRDITELTEERDKYKADADRLAEVLMLLLDPFGQLDLTRPIARAALAAHEDLGGRI